MFTIIIIVWQDGMSPLMYASQNGHAQVVAELLKHEARVDMQEKVSYFCKFTVYCLCEILGL